MNICTDYLQNYLRFYFQKALVEFANPEQKEEPRNGWGTFLAGALGAMCLGALVINRA